MKRRGPENKIPPADTGPFRKMEYTVDVNGEDAALEKMEKEIAAEGKFSIQLPEDTKGGNDVPLFEDALKKNIDPKDIVFYSLATGIVKYNDVIEYKGGSFGRIQQKNYSYTSKNDPNIKLIIWVEKNKATFATVTTKEDSKKLKENNEKRDWYYANNNLNDNIEKIKRMIRAGINPGLSELKNNVESLLLAINEAQEKKK